jgi:peptidoglycan/LPS O-acetylase OafA/YrhL
VSAVLAVAALLVRYPIIVGTSSAFVREWPIDLNRWPLPLYAVWFVAGIAAQSHLPAFQRWLKGRRMWLLVGAVLMALLALAETELMRRAGGRTWLGPQTTLLTNVYNALFVLAFLAYETADPPLAGQLRHLGTMSFGIYLMHVPILEIASRGIAHVAPGLLALAGLMYLILVTAGVGIPALAMVVARRSWFRPAYSFLFG